MRGFTSWGFGNTVFSRRVRRVCASTAAALLVGLAAPAFTGTASGNAGLDAITEVDCDPQEDYGEDAGDAALAAALAEDGYTCTGLFNKGQLPSTFEQVGELWFKAGTVLQLRVIIFGAANTDQYDAKVCLDDDDDPINDIAPGGDDPKYCEGNDADLKVDHDASGGPEYPPAPEADDQEETAGELELMVQDLVDLADDPDDDGPAAAAGGFDVDIDGYTEVLAHFNNLINDDDTSIVAYFQPEAATTTTPQDETPTIEVTKTADTPTVAEPGGNVTFTVEVTNTSTTESITLTTLDDDPYGPVTCPSGLPTLAPGETETCSVSGSVTGAPESSHDDTVTAEGEDDDGDTATDTDSATVRITDVVPTIEVDKSASASVVRTGQQVTYTYVVTTPGPESLVNVAVSDDKCSPVTFDDGDTNTDDALDPDESWTFTCATTLTGDTINTATATGDDDDGNTATDTDTASVTVVDPKIAIDKTADPKSTSPGGTVTYTYVVTNPGTGELTEVVLTDDKCSPVAFVDGDTDGDSRLDTGESWRYTCAVVVGEDVTQLTNVATVTAKDPTGSSVSASDTETIVVVRGVAFEQPTTGAVTPQQPAAAPADAVRSQAVAGAQLPATGAQNAQWLLRTGMGLLVVGTLLMVPNRRRRPVYWR